MRQARLAFTFVFFYTVFPLAAAFSAEPLEREHFVYYFDNSRYVTVADRVLPQVRQKLYRLTGDTLSYKPAIYIVDDLARFQQLLGGKFPDWGAAGAFPERRLIAIKAVDKFNVSRPLDELLAHEYSHLVVAQASGLGTPPRWFDEGIAMFVSMEWSWSDNLAMSKAAVFGQLISLAGIDEVNRFNESKAHVAYAEAYLAVRYLLDNYGENSLNVFLGALASGSDGAEALYLATGSTEAEFEADFRAHLNGRFNVASLFMDTVFFWIALAVIVIIAAFLRWRKKRQYYRKWERQEKFESTDFDWGDPDNPEEVEDDDEPWRA
ncbi:MAG: peptidase MA family metallohydrolase [Candidatus Zixiibacteriota bacterium]